MKKRFYLRCYSFIMRLATCWLLPRRRHRIKAPHNSALFTGIIIFCARRYAHVGQTRNYAPTINRLMLWYNVVQIGYRKILIIYQEQCNEEV